MATPDTASGLVLLNSSGLFGDNTAYDTEHNGSQNTENDDEEYDYEDDDNDNDDDDDDNDDEATGLEAPSFYLGADGQDWGLNQYARATQAAIDTGVGVVPVPPNLFGGADSTVTGASVGASAGVGAGASASLHATTPSVGDTEAGTSVVPTTGAALAAAMGVAAGSAMAVAAEIAAGILDSPLIRWNNRPVNVTMFARRDAASTLTAGRHENHHRFVDLVVQSGKVHDPAGSKAFNHCGDTCTKNMISRAGLTILSGGISVLEHECNISAERVFASSVGNPMVCAGGIEPGNVSCSMLLPVVIDIWAMQRAKPLAWSFSRKLFAGLVGCPAAWVAEGNTGRVLIFQSGIVIISGNLNRAAADRISRQIIADVRPFITGVYMPNLQARLLGQATGVIRKLSPATRDDTTWPGAFATGSATALPRAVAALPPPVVPHAATTIGPDCVITFSPCPEVATVPMPQMCPRGLDAAWAAVAPEGVSGWFQRRVPDLRALETAIAKVGPFFATRARLQHQWEGLQRKLKRKRE
jgi:hypothetical protein